MSELALYRKYRSQTFETVVGQVHIVTTLTNALKHGRVSHAYLLTGPRGVGKTSVARLLARAVNCSAQNVSMPCNTCEICLIPLTSNMDIIEIDAASNRKIDEIRDLRDKINLSPARSRYKVYIIDEVHMLTTEAFNALLKTLEEPPAHAIFILATTEVHKLPDTIISRTQRLNFKAISTSDLKSHLAKIAQRESIIIEPAAIAMVAESSHGSFRDAISLLDQVSVSSNPPITAATVSAVLGLSDADAIESLITFMATHQPGQAIAIIDKLTSQGVQPTQLVTQLIQRWRQIMLARLSSADNDVTPISQLSELDLAHIIRQLSYVLQSALPEIALETTIVELALNPSSVASGELRAASKSVPSATQSSKLKTPGTVPSNSQLTTPNSQLPPPSLDLWPKALILIKARNNSLYALLCSCDVEIRQDEVIITSRFNFHRDRLKESKNREIIESALTKVYGKTMKASSALEAAKVSANNIDSSAELVSSALEILGGEVVDD